MKKFFTILFSSFCVAAATNAQSVSINTDGTTADASAILDVKSTTKGFMMPRVTSAQRIGIVSPALGLLVFDTDTKTIWAYNGSAWTNLTTISGGGNLSLPFSQTVNTATSAFQITNQGAGAAIEGSSSAQLGIGMSAKANGDGSWGLYAFSNGAGSQSIRSYTENGTAFHGENNNPGNTNTLMNLLNKGAGKTGSFQLANNSSTSPNVQIAGNHLGEQLKIYQTNAANASAAVSVENFGTGTAIRGDASGISGVGVFGTGASSTSYGVRGTNTVGTGIYGFSTSGYGILASSNSGVGLRTSSTTGNALEVFGKLKIYGAPMNVQNGAVLTSDAEGNATWKLNRVAFKVSNPVGSLNDEQQTTATFFTKEYDYSNSFNMQTGGFTAPTTGVYNIGTRMVFNYSSQWWDLNDAYCVIMISRGGNLTTIYSPRGIIIHTDALNFDSHAAVSFSTDIKLQAGDIVWVRGYQSNDGGDSLFEWDGEFYGHLVFAE